MVARSSASLGLSARRSLQARIFSAVSVAGDATCTSVPCGNRTVTDVEWASEIAVASKTLPSGRATAVDGELIPCLSSAGKHLREPGEILVAADPRRRVGCLPCGGWVGSVAGGGDG